MPKVCSMALNIRSANKEYPPSAKKLSCTPMGVIPKTCSQIAASCNSIRFRGSISWALSCTGAVEGIGKAPRSTLPLGVSGNSSSETIAAGTM